MKSTILFIFCSILFSQNIQVIPYDWGGQFGYVNKGGVMMWNQDWRSNRLLFDGTWAVYPRMYGNEIEAGFNKEDPSLSIIKDTIINTSYFKYDQGDYLLDKFSFGADYKSSGRFTHIHGFKRSYAGTFNQYFNGSFQPIQQSYFLSYLSEVGKDHAGFTIGHFNTYSGVSDSTARGLFDNRITTTNIFWNRNFNNFRSILSMDHFLQRYHVEHSRSIFNGTRFLTRYRYNAEIEWRGNNLISHSFGIRSNNRNVRVDSLSSLSWVQLFFRGKLNNINYSVSMMPEDNNYLFNYVVDYNKKIRSIVLSMGFKQDYNPIHPYFYLNIDKDPDSFFYEMRSLNTMVFWKGKESQASLSYSFVEDKHNVIGLFENDSFYKNLSGRSHNNINIFYKTSLIPLIDLGLNYNNQISDTYYSGGIGNWLELMTGASFSLFDGFMEIELAANIKYLNNRIDNYFLDPVEMIPSVIGSDKAMGDATILNGHIATNISNLTFQYEWFNIVEIMLSSTGSDNDNIINLNSIIPKLGRQINISVEWHFRD